MLYSVLSSGLSLGAGPRAVSGTSEEWGGMADRFGGLGQPFGQPIGQKMPKNA